MNLSNLNQFQDLFFRHLKFKSIDEASFSGSCSQLPPLAGPPSTRRVLLRLHLLLHLLHLLHLLVLLHLLRILLCILLLRLLVRLLVLLRARHLLHLRRLLHMLLQLHRYRSLVPFRGPWRNKLTILLKIIIRVNPKILLPQASKNHLSTKFGKYLSTTIYYHLLVADRYRLSEAATRHHCCPLWSMTELPAVLEFLCRMAPLQIPNWASSSAAASNGQSKGEADNEDGPVFWRVHTPKEIVLISQNLIYTPQIGFSPTDWGYLPKLGLHPRIQFRPQKFGLSPQIRIISQYWVVIYRKVQFIPQNVGPI